MSISSVSSSNYYATTDGTTADSSKKPAPLDDLLSQVEKDLQSGDTSDAESLVSQALANAPQDVSGSSSGSDPISTINGYLKSMQSALSSGNTSDAQSALSGLSNYLSQNAPGSSGSAQSSDATSSFNPVQQFLDDLQSSLSSNDTAGASSLLDNLQSYLAKNPVSQNGAAGTYSSAGTLNDTSSESLLSLLG